MSRYVDAEELFLDFQTDPEMRLGENLEYVRKTINKQATADVRKNVHGEWIIRNVQDWKGRPTGKKFIKCDQCEEEEIISFGRSPFNFCPNCGADMRKGETNG